MAILLLVSCYEGDLGMVEANKQTTGPYSVPSFLAQPRSFCLPTVCPWMQPVQLITSEPILELPA